MLTYLWLLNFLRSSFPLIMDMLGTERIYVMNNNARLQEKPDTNRGRFLLPQLLSVLRPC